MRTALLALIVSLLASSALAQALPDVVRLNDGSFVRGTIVERVEGDHVVIQTATGELRTIPLASVQYAGPDSVMTAVPAAPPQAYAPPPPAALPTIHLTFDSEDEDVMTHRLVGSAIAGGWGRRGFVRVDAFEPLCLAPCEIDVPPGTYQFGLSQGASGNAQRAGIVYPLTTDTHFVAEFSSRGVERAIGWTVFSLSAVACVVIVLVPLFVSDYSENTLFTTLGVGLGTLVGGMAVGFPLIFLNDHAEVRIAGVDA